MPRVPEADAIADMRSAGFEPLEPYPGSEKPWLALHRCGAQSAPRLNNIRTGTHGGCRSCSSVRAPWSHERAAIIMREAGFEPLEPYPGNGLPWWCRHACGTVTTPRLANVKSGHGCSSCASNGYKPSRPGYVYLLLVSTHAALKVGITNVFKKRMADHERRFNFDVAGCWGPIDGGIPPVIEQSVKRSWAPFGPAATMIGIHGYTETVSTEHVEPGEAIVEIENLLLVAQLGVLGLRP